MHRGVCWRARQLEDPLHDPGKEHGGYQTAEFLVKRGRKVNIVDTAKRIGEELLEISVKPFLLNWLDEKGVTLMPGVQYEETTDKGLVVAT